MTLLAGARRYLPLVRTERGDYQSPKSLFSQPPLSYPCATVLTSFPLVQQEPPLNYDDFGSGHPNYPSQANYPPHFNPRSQQYDHSSQQYNQRDQRSQYDHPHANHPQYDDHPHGNRYDHEPQYNQRDHDSQYNQRDQRDQFENPDQPPQPRHPYHRPQQQQQQQHQQDQQFDQAPPANQPPNPRFPNPNEPERPVIAVEYVEDPSSTRLAAQPKPERVVEEVRPTIGKTREYEVIMDPTPTAATIEIPEATHYNVKDYARAQEYVRQQQEQQQQQYGQYQQQYHHEEEYGRRQQQQQDDGYALPEREETYQDEEKPAAKTIRRTITPGLKPPVKPVRKWIW